MSKPSKEEVAKPKVAKCPHDGADMEVADTVPATYGGKSGALTVCICPKCGNIQNFFTAVPKKEKS